MIKIHLDNKHLKNLIDYNTNYPYFYLYKDNLFTGIVYDTNEEGSVIEELMFENGKLHGTIKEWNDEGELVLEESFENGMQHGEQKQWCENQLIEWSVYKDNKFIEGKTWHIEGNLAQIDNQKESKKWDEEGNLIEYHFKKDNQKISETYFTTGQIKTRKIKHNRIIDSEYSEWNQKGILISYKQVRNELKKEENKFIENLNRELRIKKINKSCYYTFEQEFYNFGNLKNEFIYTHCSIKTSVYILRRFKKWNENESLIDSDEELTTPIDELSKQYKSFFIKAQKLNPFTFSK